MVKLEMIYQVQPVRGVCNFLGSVLPQQKIEIMDGPVLQLSFIGKQRKIHPRGKRAGPPKRQEEKRSPRLNFDSSFDMLFLLPLSLPYVNWASQEGQLFYLRSSLWSLHLPLFYFCGLFPSLSFNHHHFGLPFSDSNCLTFLPQEMGGPIFGNGALRCL